MFSGRAFKQLVSGLNYFLASTLFIWMFAGAVSAQVTASMTGSVKDATGAVIPEATVTIKHVETGTTRTAQTDAGGNYSIPSLPVGEYEVSAEKAGFKQVVRKGITLVVGQQAVVNLALEVGSVEQQVTVSAEAPLVNTTLSSTAGLVGEKEVKDLPLNGRSFDQLLTLNTGTVNYTVNDSRNAFSVSGKRPETNRFLMNGVDYIGSDQTGQHVLPYGASGQLLGVDAVREFNVQQDTYGAEYGKRAGGQVTIVTASGTNRLHGDLFEYLRNSKLDARNFFDFPPGQRLPPFKRNQFGASLGGPIKHDKLFLFGNYEGFRQRLGLSDNAIVPDDSARQGLLPLGPGGALQPVPNLKTGMLPFFAFWPRQNAPELLLGGLPTGLAQNFSNPLQQIREDFGLTRLDYNISDKDSLSANYLIDDGENDIPQANPVFISFQPMRSQLISLQETRVFSPTLLNVATAGFSRSFATSQTIPSIPLASNLSFFTGSTPGAITIGGGTGGATTSAVVTAANGSRYLANARNLFTYADDLHYTKGNHAISAGVWIQRVQQNLSGSPATNAGQVTYSTLVTFLQDAPSTFLGVPSPTPLGYRSTEAAWYVEDDIKLKPNLTLRLGLRDEMTTGWNEVSGRAANYVYDPNGVIISEPLIGESALYQNNAIALWQPRVGIAWDPKGDGKWSIRAGAGIYNDLLDNLAHRISANPPFNARISISNTPLLSLIPISGNTQPPPNCNAELQAAKIPCSIFQPGGIDPGAHTPTTEQWSFTVERELTPNLMAHIGYVGFESYHLPVLIDTNTPRPVVCASAAGCVSGGTLGPIGSVPQGTTYVPPGGRPNPYVADTNPWFYEGTSAYHALDLSLVKRASHGLTFKVNYTFSKVLDLNSALLQSEGTNQPQDILNPYDLRLNRGPAAYNLTHQFNLNYSYELPFGHGQYFASGATGVLNQLIGGWQWNGIFATQSGFPFTPQVGSNRAGTGDTHNPDVPNWNPAFSGPVILNNPNQWFNPSAFLLPTAGTFGNVQRGSLTGPGLTTFDTSFFKKFKVTEHQTLEFRAEMFNLFNHVNFYSPNPTIFSGNGVSPSAGKITKAATSRQIQFALKYSF